MDRKSLARRLGALIVATVVVLGIFLLRLVQFQLVQGEELLEKAREAGDEPEIIEDKENQVTLLDYSKIL